MLSCQDLQLIYKDGRNTKTVFDQMNLEIERGENVVLLGPSGSGKSSLIYLLSCLRKPTYGKISLDDICISELGSEEIAAIRKERFAFVFQKHFLVPYLTAVENVMTGHGDFSGKGREKAMVLLAELGLEGHADKGIHQLSGGEQQQIAIARALISDPDIIFADEPTASLDHETAPEVVQFLKNHKTESTLIFATHDMSILAGDERILYFENAKVVEAHFEGTSKVKENSAHEAGKSKDKSVRSDEKTRFLTRPLHPEQEQRKTIHSNESSVIAPEGPARVRERAIAGMEKAQRKTIDSNKEPARIRERSIASMERAQRKVIDSSEKTMSAGEQPDHKQESAYAYVEKKEQKNMDLVESVSTRAVITMTGPAETVDVVTAKTAERNVSPGERVAGARARMANARARVASVRERVASPHARAAEVTASTVTETGSVNIVTASAGETDVSPHESEAYHVERPVRIREISLANMERAQRKTVDSGENVADERANQADGGGASPSERDAIIREKVLADMERVPRKGLNAREQEVDTCEGPDNRKRYFANLERRQQTISPRERVAQARASRVLARTPSAKESTYDPGESVAMIREMVLTDMRQEQQKAETIESGENVASVDGRDARIRERVFEDVERRRVERRLAELERIVESMEW